MQLVNARVASRRVYPGERAGVQFRMIKRLWYGGNHLGKGTTLHQDIQPASRSEFRMIVVHQSAPWIAQSEWYDEALNSVGSRTALLSVVPTMRQKKCSCITASRCFPRERRSAVPTGVRKPRAALQLQKELHAGNQATFYEWTV
jgi:hypothetical protein